MQQEQKRMNILSYLKGYKKECFLSPLFKLLEACFDLTVPLVMEIGRASCRERV